MAWRLFYCIVRVVLCPYADSFHLRMPLRNSHHSDTRAFGSIGRVVYIFKRSLASVGMS